MKSSKESVGGRWTGGVRERRTSDYRSGHDHTATHTNRVQRPGHGPKHLVNAADDLAGWSAHDTAFIHRGRPLLGQESRGGERGAGPQDVSASVHSMATSQVFMTAQPRARPGSAVHNLDTRTRSP